uniref:Adenylate kinase isoenzyme 5 n=1 Tax=Meloidogyne incognita TaxID=6306 RepID=A0A914MN25_MELIC
MAARDGRSRQNYLQEHSIPQLFEGLMTGLIYNQPIDPIQFLENAIAKLRKNPDLPLKWDTFISVSPQQQQQQQTRMNTGENAVSYKQSTPIEAKPQVTTAAEAASSIRNSGKRSPSSTRSNKKNSGQTSGVSNSGDRNRRRQSGATNSTTEKASSSSRPNSLAQAANNAFIVPDAPIILFMGGPGGGKTRYATQLQDQLKEEGLVHICMPDLVRSAISRYKDKLPEWRAAAEKDQRGELIPNELAQQLVVAEMGKHTQARAFFLEGFPREAHQVEEFEKNVRPVDMALILDYDEDVLRRHMQARGLPSDVIDRRINEFKEKTLPTAKYFDDQQLLHLIPGERSDSVIIERMKKLTLRAINAGVGGLITSSNSASSSATGGIYTRDGILSRNKEGSTKSVLGTAISSATTKEDVIPKIINGGDGTENANRILNTPKVISATPIMAAPTPISTPTNSVIQQHKAINNSIPSTPQRPPSTSSKVNGSRKSTPAPAPPPPGPPSSISSSPVIKNSDEMNDPFPKGLPSEVPVILIIGAPGSNKSTFAQRIARKYEGFVQLSMGELLRRKVLENREDALWSRVGKKMDAGETIPLRICRELLYTTLHERGKNAWGFVLEGYPRSVVQVEDVEAQLGRIDLAILIDCTEPFCNESLRQRYQRGKEEGAERADDEEGIVRVRLALFKLNTLPMLKHLDDQGLLRVVSLQLHEHDPTNSEHQSEGDADEERVFQEICAIIDNTIFVHDDGNGMSLESSQRNSTDKV